MRVSERVRVPECILRSIMCFCVPLCGGLTQTFAFPVIRLVLCQLGQSHVSGRGGSKPSMSGSLQALRLVELFIENGVDKDRLYSAYCCTTNISISKPSCRCLFSVLDFWRTSKSFQSASLGLQLV